MAEPTFTLERDVPCRAWIIERPSLSQEPGLWVKDSEWPEFLALIKEAETHMEQVKR
jgi:hypothetical protein